MEADDRDPSAGPQHPERCRQCGVEGTELVVDGDAERLEDALCRVAVAEARGRRDRALDRVDEVTGALVGAHDAPADDGSGDRAGEPFLAVAAEDQLELPLVGLVHELAGREFGGRVHPHVEWRVGGVREAALGAVELHRGDAEVEQDRVGADIVGRKLVQDE